LQVILNFIVANHLSWKYLHVFHTENILLQNSQIFLANYILYQKSNEFHEKKF